MSERGLVQYLVIRGTVVLERPDIPDEYNALMDRQSQRYLGKDYPFENRGSRTALIARVTPERLLGEGPWTGKMSRRGTHRVATVPVTVSARLEVRDP